MNFEFEGILFDLDGTLIDSSEAITRSWKSFANKYNLNTKEILLAVQGKPAGESIASFRPHASEVEISQDEKWLETMEANDVEGVIALPGAVELLNILNRKNIPWGIVTSGLVPVATARIKAAGLPSPDVLITPELVSKGKPDPEPYILGASKIGVDIEKCMVFEDAPAGIRSGVSAGARAVGVLTQFDSDTLLAEQASICITSLLDVVVSFNEAGPILTISER